MTSLFSSFDLFFQLIPMISFFFIMIILYKSIYKFSSLTKLMLFLVNLNSFLYSLKPKMFTKTSLTLFSSFMMLILLINLISVFPFNFPLTSQFGVILMSGLFVWFSMVLFSMFNNINGFLSHMIPEGTPIYLTFILFMIELISNIIRPITLSVRLVANILAGHLLMILLSKLIFSSIFLFPLYAGLNLVELFVAMIQSYIFCTMISLYFSEVH